MNLTITSWNLMDGLGDVERAPQIKNTILSINPDFAVFPEAAKEGDEIPGDIIEHFESQGYAVVKTDYDDADGRLDRHSLVTIARRDLLLESEIITLEGRNAIMLSMVDGISLVGVHLYDREVLPDGKSLKGAGEQIRLKQADCALGYLGNKNAIIAGEFNATNIHDNRARVLRSLSAFADLLPSADPDATVQSTIQRLGSLAQRLCDMSTGTTIEKFLAEGFVDADQKMTPTMSKAFIGAQLDHVLVRGLIAENPVVRNPGNLSDHKILTCTVRN